MAKKLRSPEQVKRDIESNKKEKSRLEKELKDSKDANYYAAQAKKNLKKAGDATKKYSKKAGKAGKSILSSVGKFLTSK